MKKLIMLLILSSLTIGCTTKENEKNEENVSNDTVKVIVTEVPTSEIDSLAVEVTPVEEDVLKV